MDDRHGEAESNPFLPLWSSRWKQLAPVPLNLSGTTLLYCVRKLNTF